MPFCTTNFPGLSRADRCSIASCETAAGIRRSRQNLQFYGAGIPDLTRRYVFENFEILRISATGIRIETLRHFPPLRNRTCGDSRHFWILIFCLNFGAFASLPGAFLSSRTVCYALVFALDCCSLIVAIFNLRIVKVQAAIGFLRFSGQAKSVNQKNSNHLTTSWMLAGPANGLSRTGTTYLSTVRPGRSVRRHFEAILERRGFSCRRTALPCSALATTQVGKKKLTSTPAFLHYNHRTSVREATLAQDSIKFTVSSKLQAATNRKN